MAQSSEKEQILKSLLGMLTIQFCRSYFFEHDLIFKLIKKRFRFLTEFIGT